MITDANRKWWILAGRSTGMFLLMLDSTIVALALPTIQKSLDSTNEALQWVLNAYLLTLSVLVVTAGRLGDMFGRRTVFQIGMVLFAAGSIADALAPTVTMLVLGRVLQGAGAAAMLVLSLAITSNAFPPAERARALGIWAGVSAIALALGPLLGGVLIDAIGWRAIFWINLVPIVIGMWITSKAAPNNRDPEAGSHIDWPGLIVFTIAVTALILALVQGDSWGWSSAKTVVCLVAGVGGLIAFWFVEHRVAHPIVDFSLFRSGPYFGASAAAFTILGCYWTTIFYQPQFLQNVLGYSTVEAGLLILPLTAPMIAISPLAGRLIARFGSRALMTFGMSLVLIAMLLFTQIDSSTSYSQLLWPYLIFGLALGFVYAPMSTAAMTALPPEKAGIASGVLAMDRMFAGAIGLASVGALFQHVEHKQLHEQIVAKAPTLDGQERELDGLLAGSAQAKAQLTDLSSSLQSQVEQTLRDVYSFAIARSSWILVAFATFGLVLTWAFIRSDERTSDAPESRDPDPAPGIPHHHWRQWRLHL